MASILIVDDDPVIRRNLRDGFQAADHDVREAPDGQEALSFMGFSLPDIILLDIIMPGMDGWTLLKRLRINEQTAQLPIIMLSTLNSREDHIRSIQMGADEFIPKHASIREMILRAERVLADANASEFNMLEENTDETPLSNSIQNRRTTSGLFGDLAAFGPGPVLNMCEQERKTGVLVMSNGPLEARIYLNKGRLHAAEMNGRDPVLDVECIFRILTWSSGHFSLTAEPVTIEDCIGQSIASILMEGARQLDEGTRIIRRR